jgi:RHS repeat-associated protein
MDGGDLRRLMRRMRDPAFRAGMKQSVRGGVVQLSRGGLFGPTPDAEPQLMLVAVYNYDLFNRRTARIIIGIDTYVYAWDGWREVQEASWSVSGSVPRQQYVWGDTLDELLAYRNLSGGTATTYFMTQGGQDTPARLIDSTGTVVQKYEYDAYGKATVITLGMGGYLNPYRWKGMRYDPETGLGYRRNRYYSFEWGRFMTRDPLGAWADGFNWGNAYTYVGNSPLGRVDRRGLYTTVIVIVETPARDGRRPDRDQERINRALKQVGQDNQGGNVWVVNMHRDGDSPHYRIDDRIAVPAEGHDVPDESGIRDNHTLVVSLDHGVKRWLGMGDMYKTMDVPEPIEGYPLLGLLVKAVSGDYGYGARLKPKLVVVEACYLGLPPTTDPGGRVHPVHMGGNIAYYLAELLGMKVKAYNCEIFTGDNADEPTLDSDGQVPAGPGSNGSGDDFKPGWVMVDALAGEAGK